MDELWVAPPLKNSTTPSKRKLLSKLSKCGEKMSRSAKRLLKMIHGLSEWGYDCGYSRADIGVQIFSGHRISDTHLLQTLWSEALSWLLKRSRLSKMSTIREKIPFYITWHVIKVGENPSFSTPWLESWLPINVSLHVFIITPKIHQNYTLKQNSLFVGC